MTLKSPAWTCAPSTNFAYGAGPESSAAAEASAARDGLAAMGVTPASTAAKSRARRMNSSPSIGSRASFARPLTYFVVLDARRLRRFLRFGRQRPPMMEESSVWIRDVERRGELRAGLRDGETADGRIHGFVEQVARLRVSHSDHAERHVVDERRRDVVADHEPVLALRQPVHVHRSGQHFRRVPARTAVVRRDEADAELARSGRTIH